MLAELDDRLREIVQLREERDRVVAQVPAIQEELGRERYQLETVEDELSRVADQIDALNSLTPAALLAGLFGRKQARLNEERERAAVLERTADECAGRIAALEQSLADIEARLAEFGDLDATYATLCEEKRRALIEEGGGAAERITALQGDLDGAHGELRALHQTIQIGTHVLERLETMSRSLNRSRTKSLAPYNIGALPAVAVNAVVAQGSKGSVGRVKDGFGEFYERLNALDMAANDAFHDEIRGLIAEIGRLSAELGGRSTFGMVLDHDSAGAYAESVCTILGFLKEKSERLGKHITALESEQRAAIETV